MRQTEDAHRLMSGAAWTEFCDRLKAAGQRILESDFPGSPRDRAEGFRHLTRLVVLGLQESVEFSDPEFPAFYRFLDDAAQWGAPNVDNYYLRARIKGDGAYRISGNVGKNQGFIISTNEGDMQLEQYGVFAELTSSEIGIGPDGSFEIILSREKCAGNWMPLHPDTRLVLVRQYLTDWVRDEPGEFRIEKIGNEGRTPEPLEPQRMARAFDEAGEWINRTIVYWNEFIRRKRAANIDNVPALPNATKGGALHILYAHCYFDLAEDEALLVEIVPPDAWYWSMQLYTLGWFETPDFINRQTSLNGHQVCIDADGLCRAVVAHKDPGLANWLDTTGYREGLLHFRWVSSRSALVPTTRVVKFDEIGACLPAGTLRLDQFDRIEQIARRQAHFARRFRR